MSLDSEKLEHHVFLCYNSEDGDAVVDLAKQLKKRDLIPWLDVWDLRPGTSWQQALQAQMTSARSAAVCVGPSGVGPWQTMEIEVLLQELVKRKCPVVPVLLPGGKRDQLPLFMKNLNYVDFNQPDPPPLERLIWGISGEAPVDQAPEEETVGFPAGTTLTWLHLSDFHFKAKQDWHRDKVLQKLLEEVVDKLPDYGMVPDLVLVTGDVAYSGQPEEYAVAQQFFAELSNRLKNPEHRWFMVPGNHDVDRSVVEGISAAVRQLLNEKNAGDFLQNNQTWKDFSKRQTHFFNFAKTFLNQNWDPAAPWRTDHLKINGLPVAVLSLNSAWACQDGEDRNNILMGECQAWTALQEARGAGLKIALCHHPLDHMKDFDQEAVDGHLFNPKGVHFLLRGHLHKKKLIMALSPDAATLEFASGACWESPKSTHAVMAVQLDLVQKQGRVQTWNYLPDQGGYWTEGRYRGLTNGAWEFDFPKTWNLEPEPPEPGNFNGSPATQAWRNHLLDLYSQMRTLASTPEPRLFRLLDAYAPLHTRWTEPEKREGEKKEKMGPDHMASSRPITDLLELKEHRRFLISGGPGCGKSTLVRYAALRELERDGLPVLVELKYFGRDLEKQDLTWMDWVGAHLGEKGLSQEVLTRRMGGGKVLWLLDGLDEIFNPRLRLKACEAIRSWMDAQAGDHVVLVTTRPHALAQKGVVETLAMDKAEVLGLDEDQQEAFLRHWFQELYGENSAVALEWKDDLWRALAKNEGLTNMRDNPLLLSMIAAIFHKGERLPDRRANLYGQAVNLLLERRFGVEIEGDDTLVRRMRLGLETVARGMFETGQIKDISEPDFLNLLGRGHYHRKPSGEERLELEAWARDLGAHSGLLVMNGHPARYSFPHLGFQEYLAARAYGSEQKPMKPLKKRLDDGAWREVILLTAGHLFEAGTGRLGDTFVKDLAKHCQKTGCSRLALACLAVAEAPEGVLEPDFVESVRSKALDWLTREKREDPVADRMDLGLALGVLGDPRMDPAREDRWVLIEPGTFTMGDNNSQYGDEKPEHKVTISQPFHLGRYPVTNGEFMDFMEAGGYEDRRWWCEQGWEWLNMPPGRWDAWFEELKGRFQLQDDWKPFYLPAKKPHWWDHKEFNSPSQPVVGVNWFEAQAYCRWLEERLKAAAPSWLERDAKVVLPSEAWWEWAARGEEGRIYPWGREEPGTELANYDGNLKKTNPVGIYHKGYTPQGVTDMAGNVWEWCRDGWDEKAYQKWKKGVTDPEGPEGDFRVLRGGAWWYHAVYLRASFRSRYRVWFRYNFIGFRCCLLFGCRSEHD